MGVPVSTRRTPRSADSIRIGARPSVSGAHADHASQDAHLIKSPATQNSAFHKSPQRGFANLSSSPVSGSVLLKNLQWNSGPLPSSDNASFSDKRSTSCYTVFDNLDYDCNISQEAAMEENSISCSSSPRPLLRCTTMRKTGTGSLAELVAARNKSLDSEAAVVNVREGKLNSSPSFFRNVGAESKQEMPMKKERGIQRGWSHIRSTLRRAQCHKNVDGGVTPARSEGSHNGNFRFVNCTRAVRQSFDNSTFSRNRMHMEVIRSPSPALSLLGAPLGSSRAVTHKT